MVLTPSLPHSLNSHSLNSHSLYSLTPSSLTPSPPHSLIPHSLTPSPPHPSLPHPITPSIHAPLLRRSLIPSLHTPHSLTPSSSHSLTTSPPLPPHPCTLFASPPTYCPVLSGLSATLMARECELARVRRDLTTLEPFMVSYITDTPSSTLPPHSTYISLLHSPPPSLSLTP